MSVISITTPTYAGGFSTAQFGGTHGNAASDSLTSIFYNPAGLAESDGTRAYVEATAAYRMVDYTRDPDAIDDQNVSPDAIAANSGEGKLRNTIAAPFAALVTDLGHRGFSAGVGVYVPFGGQAEWSQVDKWKGNQMFPGAVDGPQRWSVTSGKQQSIFYTAAAAMRTRDNKLSFGAGVNVIQSAIQLTRARNVTGSDNLSNSDGSISEGRSYIDVSNIDVSIGVGFTAQVDDHTRLGISYQSQPLGGEQVMKGDITNKFGDSALLAQKVELRQRLPDSVRAAFEWRDRRFAVRGGAEWTHWSVYQDQCITDATTASPCQFAPSGAFDPSAEGSSPLLEIPRNWTDNFGLAIGGSYWAKPKLELSASLHVDSNAVPDSTLEPALLDANKLITMVAARYTRGKIDLDVSLANVMYETRTTAPRTTVLLSPSRSPDMAGKFEQTVWFALIGVGVRM